jgi:O-antigen/teichoic acid export membrane protein
MWTSQILLLVPQLLLVPYLIGTIGEAGYGVYALVWSLMMSIDLLEKSLQSGVVKFSAGLLAQGRTDEVNKVVSSSFVYSFVLAGLTCSGVLILAGSYNGSGSSIEVALIVVSIMILLIVPLTPYIAAIQSRQIYYVGAIAETVAKYVGLLSVVAWFYTVRPTVEALVVIMAGTLFLSRLAQAFMAKRFVPTLKIRPSLFDWMSFRHIASFGAAAVLAALCLAANSTGIRWLMNSLVSTTFVTHLVVMIMPALLLSQIVGAMTVTVMPATSAYVAAGKRHMLPEFLLRGLRYTTILVLTMLLAASFLMKDLLIIWVGHGYVFLVPYALFIFSGRAIIQSTSVAHQMLKGLGKLKIVVLSYLLGLVVLPFGLILSIFGMSGDPYLATAIGLSIGYLVSGCLQITFCAKAVHADVMTIITRAYGQPIMVAAAVWLAVSGVVVVSDISGFGGNIRISTLAVLLYLCALYALIATKAERIEIKDMVQSILERISALNRWSDKKLK